LVAQNAPTPLNVQRPTTHQSDAELASLASQAIAGLANVPLPLALLDLSEFIVRAVNAAMLELTGLPAEQLVGRRAVDFTPPDRRVTTQDEQQALADGRLEGFEASTDLHLPNGTTLAARVWARRLVVTDYPWALVVVLPRDERASAHAGFAGSGVDLMMAVTDHDWFLTHVSADARRVLGTPADDLIGQALLGLVHPGDAADFVLNVTTVVSSRSAVACGVRIRGRDHLWRDVSCTLSVLCEHSPPRLGVAMSRRSDPDHGPKRLRRQSLEQTLWRIAMELRAAGLVSDEPTAITHAEPHHTAQLSGRQWEIVQRLAQGQTATRIASEMYLSPSTVRNHLTAIYRKYGVHSQVELIAALGNGDRTEPVTVTGHLTAM
jgi:PAS domain S-box-containing protein